MEAHSHSKIRFFLEPIHVVEFDSKENPNQRKNLKLHKLYTLLLYKILFLAASIPASLIVSFTWFSSIIFTITIPLVILISVYLLKLKILFQRVSKRITEPIQKLNPGEFVGYESKGQIHIFMVLKKSMALYYLKKISFEDIFKNNQDVDIKNTNYTDLKIIKNRSLYRRYMRVVPVSANRGTTLTFKQTG